MRPVKRPHGPGENRILTRIVNNLLAQPRLFFPVFGLNCANQLSACEQNQYA